MIGLLRSQRERIPFLGEIVFSILIIPVTFTFVEKWFTDRGSPDTSVWACVLYVVLGLVHLFRAFRLRGQYKSTFIAHLVYGAAFVAGGALAAVTRLSQTTITVLLLVFWGCIVAERALDSLRNRKIWRILLNAVAIFLIINFALNIPEMYSMVIVGFVVSLSSFLSIMILMFSQMRLDILKEIIRKTNAVGIIGGLLVMMVTFSNVLYLTDDAFSNFWDALWYCFAIVTTIGFGDLTPSTPVGRVISVILGIYGIVVVALITSIIVNFYGEMKKTESD